MRWCAHLYAGQASGHNNGNGGHVAMEALSPDCPVYIVAIWTLDTPHSHNTNTKQSMENQILATFRLNNQNCYMQVKGPK